MAVTGIEKSSLLQAEEFDGVAEQAPRTRGKVLIAGGLSAGLLLAGSALAISSSSQSAADLHAFTGFADAGSCTTGRGNCNTTQCCAGSGLQCYEQDKYYAQCRESCIAGAPDPTHWNGNVWSCKELGTRSPGEPECGHQGDDCRESKCCADPGFQCYEKNDGWATCKAECTPDAPDMTDMDGSPWTCKELGERAPGAQPWIAEQCSVAWDDCMDTQCCKNAGEACHKQSDFYGNCMPTGSCHNPGWSCEIAGHPTPGRPHRGGLLPDWALEQCSLIDEGCAESRCCVGMDIQCYQKDENWAQCRQSCEPGAHEDDNGDAWTCKELSPRAYGKATKGFPSLYCFSVIRVDGYEKELLQASWDRQAGIFACDDYDLLTAEGSTTVGEVQTISFPGAEIVTSIDGTAGNTFLFVNAWNAVMGSNKWRDHAFTCKVDPDAVFVPNHLRWHVQDYVGEKMFVINCHVGDMVYGALEVYSFAAMQAWNAEKDTCNTPNNFGEDKYMTQCMDHIGAYRVHDESIMGDKLCGTFTDCGNQVNAAYHPFKDLPSWSQCMDAAMR